MWQNIEKITKKMRKFLSALLAITLFIPVSMAAETEVGDVNDFGAFVSNFWEWGSQIIFATSVLMIIIGGIVLMFSGENENTANTGKSIIKGAVVASVLVICSALLIKTLQKPTDQIEGTAKISDLNMVITNVSNLVFGLIGALAVLAIIYDSYLLLFSGGDSEKQAKAKKGFFYATIGLIIAVSAYTIQNYVLSVFV